MPAKKKTAKQTAARKKAPAKRRPRYAPVMSPFPATGGPCDLATVCTYLKSLSDWLEKQFLPDYKALRIAVCNVEKQAFSGNGNPNKPPRFCTGGGGNEPADPPKPPVW